MNRPVYNTFAEAYKNGLQCLVSEGRTVEGVTDPLSPGSQFGKSVRNTVELVGHAFEVASPSACLLVSKARPLRLAYCIGSLIWTLNGSDNLEEISFYNPLGRNFSDDGSHLSGAFGKRLFRYAERIDQLGVIMETLRSDPASRRTA